MATALPTRKCRGCLKRKPLAQFNGDSRVCKKCQGDGKVKHHGRFCRVCCDIPWRRPRNRVCKCGGVYEEEQMPRAEAHIGSSAGSWWEGGESDLANTSRDERGEFRKRGENAPEEFKNPWHRRKQ